jgi:hypothetical protein
MIFRAVSKDRRKAVSHINLAQRVVVPLIDSETKKIWEIPRVGLLKIVSNYTPSIPTKTRALSEDGLNSLLQQLENCDTSFDMKKLLRIAAKDLYLFTRQAQRIVDKLAHQLGVFDIIACLLSRLLDSESNFAFLCQNLPSTHVRKKLMNIVGTEQYKFSPSNPTGHWRLNLGLESHRNVFRWLAAINGYEANASQFNSGRNDTSQMGDYQNWRNAEYCGKTIILKNEFASNFPQGGTIELDYCSTTRPPPEARPISASDLRKLINQLGIKVASLQIHVCACAIACTHTHAHSTHIRTHMCVYVRVVWCVYSYMHTHVCGTCTCACI